MTPPALAEALVKSGRGLVYGGGNDGIMGIVAQSVLAAGGQVTGVIPYAMVAAGGEAEQLKGSVESKGAKIALIEQGREKVWTMTRLNFRYPDSIKFDLWRRP